VEEAAEEGAGKENVIRVAASILVFNCRQLLYLRGIQYYRAMLGKKTMRITPKEDVENAEMEKLNVEEDAAAISNMPDGT
jgi:hypothetical protein